MICLLNFVKYIFVYQTMSLQKSAVFDRFDAEASNLVYFRRFWSLTYIIYAIAQSSDTDVINKFSNNRIYLTLNAIEEDFKFV